MLVVSVGTTSVQFGELMKRVSCVFGSSWDCVSVVVAPTTQTTQLEHGISYLLNNNLIGLFMNNIIWLVNHSTLFVTSQTHVQKRFTMVAKTEATTVGTQGRG